MEPLTTQQAAEILKAKRIKSSSDSVAELARKGDLPATKDVRTNRWQIQLDDLERYIRQRKRRKLYGWLTLISLATLVPLLTLISGTISGTKDALDLVKEYIGYKETSSGNVHKQSQATPPSLPRGIYISKIIDPPRSDESPTKTSVWLVAYGPSTYIIDSVRIEHFSGMCMGAGSGAFPPDANYQYTYEQGSHKEHVLNPALRLSPTDQREVSFTLGLAPEGFFSSVCGGVTVWLNYHTAEGVGGVLLLEEPSENGRFFSRLLDKNIMEFPRGEKLIVAPNGMQIGYEEGVKAITYAPLKLALPYYSDEKLNGAARVRNYDKREALNEAIKEQRKLQAVLEVHSVENTALFDLCAGMLNKECEKALIDASSMDELLPYSLEALSIRHAIQPSETLAVFMANKSARIATILQCRNTPIKRTSLSKSQVTQVDCSYKDILTQAISELSLQPIGPWYEALSGLAEFDRNACDTLKNLESKLRQDQIEHTRRLCNRQ